MKKATPKVSTAIRVEKGLLADFKKTAAAQNLSFTFLLNRQMRLAVLAHKRRTGKAVAK